VISCSLFIRNPPPSGGGGCQEGVYEDFEARMTGIKADLVDKGIHWEKEIVEFSVFDTKVEHDSAWIQAGSM